MHSGSIWVRTIRTNEYAVLIEKLIKARHEAGLRQIDVAKFLNRPQSFISRVELGEYRLDVLELKRVAEMYKRIFAILYSPTKFMVITEIIISTIISTGLIAALINHWYEKRIKAYEIKLHKFLQLNKELAKLIGNEPDWKQLRTHLNEALLFASDQVVFEILKFNKKFTEKRQTAAGDNFQMTAQDIQPLIVTIRKELYLKSKSIDKNGLTFFQKLK